MVHFDKLGKVKNWQSAPVHFDKSSCVGGTIMYENTYDSHRFMNFDDCSIELSFLDSSPIFVSIGCPIK